MIDSLQEGVVSLIRDLNGNHVIQRCLQRLGPEDSQFVYDAACAHTMEIATHRHGCCVLQRCIDFATPVQKKLLVAEIAANALPLSQVCIHCPGWNLNLDMSRLTAQPQAHGCGCAVFLGLVCYSWLCKTCLLACASRKCESCCFHVKSHIQT